MNESNQSEIIIYTSKDGRIELNVNLSDETVWLSLAQMATLFGRDKSVVSRHLTKIFKNNELDKDAVVANYATTASDGKSYHVDYYNLDAILSVGYRVNSKEGSEFRKWSSQVLKEYLINGYALNKVKLAERGVRELEKTIELLQKTLVHNELVNDLGKESFQIILNYAKTWHLLLAYDEDKLSLPEDRKQSVAVIDYTDALEAIASLKDDLLHKKEASELFGQEREEALSSILKNIEQTFFGEDLYKSPEEKAGHLLYFVIKDHPFTDGNKRIGCFLFLLYLKLQHIPLKLNDNGLVVLALLVAESDPEQKDLIIRLIINLLIDIKSSSMFMIPEKKI
jgi:prophage maintenance system killer protein/prophage antirepressor-like protein